VGCRDPFPPLWLDSGIPKVGLIFPMPLISKGQSHAMIAVAIGFSLLKDVRLV
jgi:hypothetical protein